MGEVYISGGFIVMFYFGVFLLTKHSGFLSLVSHVLLHHKK